MNIVFLKSSKSFRHLLCSIFILLSMFFSIHAEALKCKRAFLDINLQKIKLTLSEPMTSEGLNTLLTTARLEATQFNLNIILSVYSAMQAHSKIDLMSLDNSVYIAAKFKQIDEQTALHLAQIIKTAWHLLEPQSSNRP